ncbi:unnamed protein product [Protopolystoma xenopodis]|uniref:Uncharacterized protein n=1 Tax=Protopolystoma xenopodis TaxID=117903 RepID=A0A448XDR7_9PLAT|nr:unnamed protein product [Protopolystoma xenopodis]
MYVNGSHETALHFALVSSVYEQAVDLTKDQPGIWMLESGEDIFRPNSAPLPVYLSLDNLEAPHSVFVFNQIISPRDAYVTFVVSNIHAWGYDVNVSLVSIIRGQGFVKENLIPLPAQLEVAPAGLPEGQFLSSPINYGYAPEMEHPLGGSPACLLRIGPLPQLPGLSVRQLRIFGRPADRSLSTYKQVEWAVAQPSRVPVYLLTFRNA